MWLTTLYMLEFCNIRLKLCVSYYFVGFEHGDLVQTLAALFVTLKRKPISA